MKNMKLSSIFVLLLGSHGAHAGSVWFGDISGALPLKDIGSASLGMSIPRPSRPFDGEPALQDSTGIFSTEKCFTFAIRPRSVRL
jgi:hypothetical protein